MRQNKEQVSVSLLCRVCQKLSFKAERETATTSRRVETNCVVSTMQDLAHGWLLEQPETDTTKAKQPKGSSVGREAKLTGTIR